MPQAYGAQSQSYGYNFDPLTGKTSFDMPGTQIPGAPPMQQPQAQAQPQTAYEQVGKDKYNFFENRNPFQVTGDKYNFFEDQDADQDRDKDRV